MNWIYFSVIGIGLAMDAFAVSVTSGITINRMRLRHALQISLTFGLFQAVMPAIGWLLAGTMKNYVIAYDHWIAFGLLTIIGVKMIYEAQVGKEIEKESNPLNIYILFILAIATSLDALVVGITFSVLSISIILPVIIIGVITFFMSLIGVYTGNRYGHLFNAGKVEIAAGIILILLGVKILIQHVFFE